MSAPPPYDPSVAIQEMQKLDDIEADLADTALAVAAIDEDNAAAAQPAQAQHPELEAQASTGAEALVQNAEAIEQVLEQAIPDAPEASSGQPASQSATPAAADLNDPPAPVQSTPTPTPGSAAADVLEAVQAVAADVNVPILPETVIPPAQTSEDTDMETQAVQVDEEATSGTIDALAVSPASVSTDIASPSSKPVHIPSGAGLPPRPDVAEPGTSLSLTPVKQEVPLPSTALTEHALPIEEVKPPVEIDLDLPEGLDVGSTSILSNPDLVRAWARDPKNPNIVLALFNWSAQKSEIADARAWYSVLAREEPTAVQPLLTLINLELALSNFSEVEQLFAQALRGASGGVTAAADVSVWKAYLHYIRRQNTITEANAEVTRGTITKAYEYALQECGTDRESGEIWQEYIAFMAEVKPKDTWDAQAQVDTLRKIYQQAVRIPLNNVEALWKAYDAFESSNNKATAKKFLAERSPAYMTARTALRELRSLTDSLPRTVLPPRPTFSDADRQMVNAWKGYLKWEENNPLVIEDAELLNKRIGYALKKCLSEMRHFPEMWHYASHHYILAGQVDKAAEILSAGAEACPSSLLLTFALADTEEDRKNFARCHEIYEALLNRLNPEIEDLKKQVAVEVETARGPEIFQKQGDDTDMTGDGMSEVQKLIEEREARGRIVAERRGKDVADLAAAAGVVWVMYMRFARRTEGIKAARGVFGKARKAPNSTWHIYEASAMMEYHVNKDSSVAIRIFELGLKMFSEEVDYVVKYLQFLLSINDDTNARALFERSAAKISAEKGRPLWDTWARYEYMFGDLSGVHKLEARFAEVFPGDSALKRFAQRFTYNGLDQIALRDLGFGLRHPPALPAPVPAPQSLPTFAPQPVQAIVPPQAVPVSNQIQSIPPPRPVSPPIKRSHPESPRQRPPSPAYKRPRAQSPPNRFTPPRDRIPSVGSSGPPPPVQARGFRNGGSKDRSPAPGGYGPRRDGPPGYGPPGGGPGGYGPPPPAVGGYGAYDRSGLSRPLTHFIRNLPSARAFDGPVFRPDDIIGLFSNIARDGSSTPFSQGPPPPPVPHGGYGPPGGGYVPPPPVQGRGGYGEPRGYGGQGRRY